MNLSNKNNMSISHEDLIELLNKIPQILTELQPLMDNHCLTKGLTLPQQQAIFLSCIYSIILPNPQNAH